MRLPAGSYVGPFEIVGFLGAGGMGEVYRARDRRLKRDVAIKLLPARFSTNVDWLRRFEAEAKAAGQINHPNVLAIYDVGTHEESPYVVCELLEGETLRGKLTGGPLPARRAFEYARQLCEGLAAAHDKGIIHRDLKPDNVFITGDGRLKILDFGLAKLVDFDAQSNSIATVNTLRQETVPGAVLGTAGYMAPEQVRGQPVDHRADIFSVGAILYEMLTGRRAFDAGSSIETMNSILHAEPAAASSIVPDMVPGVERVIEHCLEKSPAQRFQTARDLGFALHTLSNLSASSPSGVALPARRRSLAPALFAAVALCGGAAVGFVTARRASPSMAAASPEARLEVTSAPVAPSVQEAAAPARYTRLTFRGQPLGEARFAPDGKTIYYQLRPRTNADKGQLRSVVPPSPESTPLGVKDVHLLSVSRTGELAVLLRPNAFFGFSQVGTLARMNPAGQPREVQERVCEADWAPDGSLAMVSDTGMRRQLEYPKGNVLFRTNGYLSNLRISPKGDKIAFLHHPVVGDDQGEVVLVDLDGQTLTLSKRWASSWGLAWASPSEIWFTGVAAGADRELHAVTLDGKERLVGAAPEQLVIQDIAADGRVLLARSSITMQTMAMPAGAKMEVNLSWFDWTGASHLTADGKLVLLTESGAGGGAPYRTYVRRTDGTDDAILLTEGYGERFSPDGKSILVRSPLHHEQLQIVPVGAGEAKVIPAGKLVSRRQEQWLPDGKRIFYVGVEPGHAERAYLQTLPDGAPEPLPEHPELLYLDWITPDGRYALAAGKDHLVLVPLDGSAPVAGTAPLRGQIGGFAPDGRALVIVRNSLPWKLVKLDLRSGKEEPVRDIMPSITEPGLRFQITPDAATYVYSSIRNVSDLYLAEGLK